MKLTHILPAIKNKVHHFIRPQTHSSVPPRYLNPPMPIPEISKPVEQHIDYRPVMLSKKAQEAVEAVNSIRNKKFRDEIFEMGDFLPEPYSINLTMKNGDSVQISRQREINPNLDFTFFDKNGQEREKFNVATQSVICYDIPDDLCMTLSSVKGQVHGYSTTRNKVMRPTDPMNRDPKHEMTFEETVRTRPVILKRINSLLEKLGKEVSEN